MNYQIPLKATEEDGTEHVFYVDVDGGWVSGTSEVGLRVIVPHKDDTYLMSFDEYIESLIKEKKKTPGSQDDSEISS